MNPVRMCGLGTLATTAKIAGRVLLCILGVAMCLPARVVAQSDPAPEQQQDSQAQRNDQRIDLAAEIETLKREIEDIKAQLARITALQRLQTERLLQQSEATAPAQMTPPTPPPAQPLPRTTRQQPVPPASTTAASVPGESANPTVFVFKDGTRTEAHNFAIVGGTLWIYTDQEAKKYAVSYIDVPATTAANATRGNKFQMPESR